ncbi:MAPEG family protein [Paraglaciecola chathamensis]|uniref:MAPEG family protein n=1 Tax=Paraglaciecola chathamensis TaxID=368405 RepID=A0ABS0WJY9_9ALTE|nr:MAPEG family protein [Paraglaciecola chathamensis]MBJ2138733.1 MAPEG family protein [Paraglaciecola chathamensis]MDO6841263.1 MAPEG family protein [Paraglaciecola chathamensis]
MLHTPITAFYGGLLGITFMYLSILVIQGRRSGKISLGDGGDNHFLGVIRAHANFAEYVPLILVLMLVAEINQAHVAVLHSAGVALLIGRLVHAYGLKHHSGASWQRVSGMLLTFIALIGLSIQNIVFLY